MWTGCTNSVSRNEESNTSWVFVANEGSGSKTEGTISMIDEFGNISQTDVIGSVVQSLEVYNNKLIVLVNNSHKIYIYDISSKGLNLPGWEIPTNNSSPREMVIISDKVYFTNWNTKDLKVLDLHTYTVESLIKFEGLPEDIVTDGNSIWVTLPMIDLYDPNYGTKVAQIDIDSKTIVTYHEVGRGPDKLTIYNNEVYVSRTYYSDNFIESFFGISKIGIDNRINISDDIVGIACGGSILNYNNKVYRSFEGGIAPIIENLGIDALNRIGNYIQDEVYHVEIINDNIWFCITNWTDRNLVKVINNNGQEIESYNVGIIPGDLAYWKKSE